MNCWIFLLFSSAMFAQDTTCVFNAYNKTGGLYFFSTFYEPGMQTPLNGTCQSNYNGKLYEKRVFKNGRMLQEICYHTNGKLRSEFKLQESPIDKKIAVSKRYSENGILEAHSIYYYNKENRRCEYAKEFWPNGKLQFEQHNAWARKADLDPSEFPNHPPHTIDEDGFTYLRVAFGDYFSFYENGNPKEYIQYNPVFTMNYDEIARNGVYKSYWENGQIQSKGFYKESNKDSTWILYDYNGKLSEENYYSGNMKFGTWKGFHSDGSKRYVYDYLVEINGFLLPNQTEWNEKGIQTLEIIRDKSGNSSKKIWTDAGILIEQTSWNEQTKINSYAKCWYPTGNLKSVLDNRINADTNYIEYYENGVLAKVNAKEKLGDTLRTSRKEWNSKAILTLEISSLTAPDSNVFSLRSYYNSGKLEYSILDKNKVRVEEFFHSNGTKKNIFHTTNGLLNGNFQRMDSTGIVREDSDYANGLRHGIYKKYSDKGVLVFEQKYENGCLDPAKKNLRTAPVSKLQELSNEEKKVVLAQAYTCLNSANSEAKKLIFSQEEIDSMAQRIMWLKEFWSENSVFPLDENNTKLPKIEFRLPVYYFKGADLGDTSVQAVKDFVRLFAKLGWQYPTTMLVKDGVYIFAYEDSTFYSDIFWNKYFSYYFQNGLAFIAQQGTINTDVEYGFNKRRKMPTSLQIYRKTSCVFEANLAQTSATYRFLIYDDGSVEFYNQSKTWEDVEKTAGNFIEIGWD